MSRRIPVRFDVPLTEEMLATLAPEDIAYMEIQAALDFYSTPQLDFDQYGALVDAWNDMLPDSRRKIRAGCQQHDFVDLPYKPTIDGQAIVCRFCMQYAVREV